MEFSQSVRFGKALDALLEGKRVRRSGWNGQGMFLYYVPANSYPAQTDAAKNCFGDEVPYGAYIAIKTQQGSVEAGWRPTNPDMFSDDWEILD